MKKDVQQNMQAKKKNAQVSCVIEDTGASPWTPLIIEVQRRIQEGERELARLRESAKIFEKLRKLNAPIPGQKEAAAE